jgi:2-haloacid dehalogenase
MNRRDFNLGLSVALAASTTVRSTSPANAGIGTYGLEAVALDGFAILDARPVFKLAEVAFPGRGDALGAEWRGKLFQYTWLRASSQKYVDFDECIREALIYAADALKLELSAGTRDQLLFAYSNLQAFEDCREALLRLKASGHRLVVLANPTTRMLEDAVNRSNLDGIFDDVISTGRAQTFKPTPRAYQLGLDSLRLPAEKVGFAASAGWDAAGAKWFGYRSFLINRQPARRERLGAEPDWEGRDLTALADAMLA